MFWKDALLVAAGGALGAVARFSLSTAMPRLVFPWHTLAANLVGSFTIGYFLLESGMEHSARLWFAVGFLGAFTTLSTYSLETVDLWRVGHIKHAAANALLNGVGGPLMALLGWKLAS